MGEGIGKALGCLALIAVAGIVYFIISLGYFIFDNIGEKIIESKVIVYPEIRLETDGKKIDTVYVYKFK